jgi:uncharacterized membrane protein
MFLFVSIFFGGSGFILSQISIKMEKASQVWLVSTAAANLIIFLSSFLYFKETGTVSEVAGIVLMMFGSALLFFNKAK